MLENLEQLTGQLALLKKNTNTSFPVYINLDLASESYFRYEQDIIGGGQLDNFIKVRKATVAIRFAQLLASEEQIGMKFESKKRRDALVNVVKAILDAATLLADMLPADVSSNLIENTLINAREGLGELERSPHPIFLHVSIAQSAVSPTWGDVTGA